MEREPGRGEDRRGGGRGGGGGHGGMDHHHFAHQPPPRDYHHHQHHREQPHPHQPPPPPRDYYEREGPPQHEEPLRVDRERTCPFLLPIFVRQGDHSPPTAYHGLEGVPSDLHVSEMHIYTWEDATLLELAELVRERIEDVRTKRAFRDEAGPATKRFPDQHFCLVYPDREGAWGGRGQRANVCLPAQARTRTCSQGCFSH